MTNKGEEDSRSGYSSNVHSPNTPMTTMTNSREKKTVGSRTTSVIPFHIPTIPKPQDEFNIFVNNTNQPFEHVWLQRTEDGSRFIHPMEKHSWFDFIDYNVGLTEPVKPLPLENTPFKLVEEVKELKILSAKLSVVDEFAVDLEHNQYRSFQGLTCLMQISTRTEDFVIDTLKLRVHVGPYLREVFKDPSKRKVMHGADRDIVWLQRDFGIYICNLFDTQQASKLLNLERNSLEYLLLYFCGITVNKAYQNADWRLRPLPDDMLKYAREDTHYLLYIYDLMRCRLLSSPAGPSGINPLLEAYENTYAICTQLYEKELLTSTSYLYIYGLQEADFNSQQLSIVSGLSEWRDAVARAEDESTGYILPNKTLLEIARQMPLTVGKLRRLVKSNHPYVDVNLDSIVAIIKSSIQNASAFESTVQLLKMRRQGIEIEPNTELASTFSCQQGNTDDGSADRVNGLTTWCLSASVPFKSEYPRLQQEISESSRRSQSSTFQPSGRYVEPRKEQDNLTVDLPREDLIKLRQLRGTHTDNWNSNSAKAFSGAAVQVADKPSNLNEIGTLALKAKCKIDPEVTKKKIEVASPVPQLGRGDGVNLVNGKTMESLPAFVHINGEVQCVQRKEVGSSICCQRERIDEAINEVNWQTSLSVSPSLHVNEESVAEHIMEETSTVSSEQETVGQGEGVGRVNWPTMKHSSSSVSFKKEYTKLEPDIIESCSSQGSSLQPSNFVEETMACQRLNLLEESSDVFGQKRGTYTNKEKSYLAKNFSEATEEVLNKPIYNFGLRASIPKSEFDSNSKGESEQIESRAISPFQSSTCSNEELMPFSVNTNKEILSSEYSFAMPTGTAKSETTSLLGTHLADLEPLHSAPVALINSFESKEDKNNLGNISVPCLSSNFQNDIQYTKGQEKSGHTEKAQELDPSMAVGVDKGLKNLLNLRKGCNSSLLTRIREDELTNDFQKGKQYQTYLLAGNHTVND